MPLSPGQLLGPYEIRAPLGAGGMGEVYRAFDPKLGREVAVKVLSPDRAFDRESIARLSREARAASALSHPAILTIHDVGEADGHPYVVMELVDGQPLDEALAAGPLPVRRALALAAQLADGLASAHEAGIVHRDLKPGNVMVTRDGRAKLVDFGLATVSAPEGSDEARLTRSGHVVGTAAYMSPEQARGKAVDARSDQFALGALLYEMLTGRAAFARPSLAETLLAVVDEEPPPLSRSRPGVPEPVAWVVERCLSKDPDDRYVATRDLARELRALSERVEPDSAATVVLGSRPRSGAQRRPRVPVAVALALLSGLAVGALGTAVLLRRSPPAGPELHRLTYSGADAAPAFSPSGQLVAFVSTRDGTSRVWLKDLAAGTEAPLTEGPDDLPRFSPDGSQAFAAYGNPRGGVVVVEAELGLYSAKVADNAFARVLEGPVACASFIAGELWACTSQFDQGFELGRSSDGGKTFTPVMELAGITGPLECPAASTVGTVCSNTDFDWEDVCRDIGKCGFGTGGQGNAGSEDDGGCGCRSTSKGANGALGLLALAALGFGWGRGQRRAGRVASGA
ncbi:serine/threonine-protein kinase [Acidobacteria bacterium ACD]|nr:serine/threonine-protein kinase [Acidobacteria bacterium ACD]